MSSGDTNFINLNSINEIQDIINGDFIFVISQGQIYKLDYQNFVIGKDNVDFYTTIESLSSQVVTNTLQLSAINGYINDNKPAITDAINTTTTVNELSSTWASTYVTTHSLSSQTWLPIPTDDNPFGTGSLVYYDGTAQDWLPIKPAANGTTLVTGDQGLPVWGSPVEGSSETPIIRNETATVFDDNLGVFGLPQSRIGQLPNNGNSVEKTIYTDVSLGDDFYTSLRVSTSYTDSVKFIGETDLKDYVSITYNTSYEVNSEEYTSHVIAISDKNSTPTFRFKTVVTVKALNPFTPMATNFTVDLHYDIFGTPVDQ